MDKQLEKFVLLMCLVSGLVYSRERRAATPRPDPCDAYTIVNDTFLDVSYTNLTYNLSSIYSVQWYRYLATGQGILTTTCPSGTQCGTTNQAWLNDTPPSYSNGATMVNVCFKNATNCCASKGTVRVKNCKTFLVYFLMPQSPPYRWCFDKILTPLVTVKDPAGSDKEPAGSSTGLIAGAAGGSAVAAGLIILGVVLAVRHTKMRANAVDSSKPDQNSAENSKSPDKPANGI